MAISFPIGNPEVLQRGADNVIRLEAYEAGLLRTPTPGTVALYDPAGLQVIAPVAFAVVDDVATYTIAAAALPVTLDLSPLYQLRWSIDIGGTTYDQRRECAVSLFKLYPVVSERDLVIGEYPDLVKLLTPHNRTLQPFLDKAWKKIIQKLWTVGRWPETMLSQSAFQAVHEEWTYFLIFKFLYRNTAGAGGGRWERLMDFHEAERDAAWSALASRIDHNHDGFPDEDSYESAGTLIQRNVHRYAGLPRNGRW